jgi:predicted alpha/beta-hydrolase family hydrolase
MDVLGLVNVRIPMAGCSLAGQLAVSRRCRGLVVFAHGNCSSRLSPRNQYAARALARAGFGTLLLDLLTADEAGRRHTAFDVALLADRLIAATLWLRLQRHTAELPVGYFGVGAGAAAALAAAVQAGREIGAIVSRGGRPDLAADWLPGVAAPTLLIVGGRDAEVIELNRKALRQLRVTAELVIVPGATHQFEELGALEEVARLAAAWFGRYLDGLDAAVNPLQVNRTSRCGSARAALPATPGPP